MTNTENFPVSSKGRTPWPREIPVVLTQLFQHKVLIIVAPNINGEGVQVIRYFSAIPLPLSFFLLYPSPLFQPFYHFPTQLFSWSCLWIAFAEFGPFSVYFAVDLLCSKHPVAICATLVVEVNFGLWKAKAPLFSTTNQGFYSCANISKMMELLERKKRWYIIFLHFMTEADSQHFLAWLLSFQTSAQVRGNCLSSSELEARDWHLLKWNTPHSLHFLIKPQAFPSS